MKRTLLMLVLVLPLNAQSLRQLADQRGIRIGAAVDPSHFTESLYAATLSREFNQAQAENAMKFGPIHPGPTTYNFAPPDSIVAFAKSNNMAVRGHTLVWHNQNPSWVTSGGFTPAQLSDVLKSHIAAVAGHYAGQVYAWDVVNEAFNDNGTIRSTIWSDAPGIGLTGTAYIEQAFRWAHDADPNALLFYNDYNGEGSNSKSDAIFKMAQDFVARGVPIHGIGLQMHFTSNAPSIPGIDANIKRITDLGLQVHITELDVRLTVDSSGVASAALLATQAQIYRDLTAVCLKYPRCTAIQTWGFTDKYSWIPGTYPGLGAALPFDAAYQSKPAYTSMQGVLASSPPVIAANGLVNGASYEGTAVSAGEVVTLFGATYGPPTIAFGQPGNGMFPTVASGTRLYFDGVPAPMIYSRVGQMSAVAPFSIAGKSASTVWYEYQNLASNPIHVNVSATHPGVFSLDSTGSGPGAILDAANRPVSTANPAARGDTVVLFATGGGVFSPAMADGAIAPASDPPQLAAKVTATIGGIDCPVRYAGAAPGLIGGVVQINVQVDSVVPSGAQPVVVNIAGSPSQAGVTVAIR